MAQYTSTVTTSETDVDSSGKKSTKDITATTAPAQTNQYEHADWRLSSALPSATIAFFDVAGSYAQAIFLGIHRITNEWNQDVIVETEHFKTRVGPSRSIDVSSAQVIISTPPGVAIDDGNPPHGSYMLLCCSIAVAQASAAKLTGTDTPAPSLKTPTGGGGGSNGGGNGDGGNPKPKPDPPKPPPPTDLDALKKLLDEVKQIEEKLALARKYGQAKAADHLAELLAIVEKRIGQAAIALADNEINQLGTDAAALGG